MPGWRDNSYLLGGNGFLAGLVEFFNGLLIVTQILLTANKNDWETLTEMEDFRDPLQLSTCQSFLIIEAGLRGFR